MHRRSLWPSVHVSKVWGPFVDYLLVKMLIKISLIGISHSKLNPLWYIFPICKSCNESGVNPILNITTRKIKHCLVKKEADIDSLENAFNNKTFPYTLLVLYLSSFLRLQHPPICPGRIALTASFASFHFGTRSLHYSKAPAINNPPHHLPTVLLPDCHPA